MKLKKGAEKSAIVQHNLETNPKFKDYKMLLNIQNKN